MSIRYSITYTNSGFQELRQFTIFNKLIPELRWKIWCHCMAPPGRAVFDHRPGYGSSFYSDEDVVALEDDFFWRGSPVLFQICRESRYIGKLRVFSITGLDMLRGDDRRSTPTLQDGIQIHPMGLLPRILWFSPKDTIEIPIRSSVEFSDVEIASGQITNAWVKAENPLRVRMVQFSFLVTETNRLDLIGAKYLISVCSLVGKLGRSVTIFIGMGAGYSHKGGRFYLNDAQEEAWVYNKDGTFCNPERQKQEDEEGISMYELGNGNGHRHEDKDEGFPRTPENTSSMEISFNTRCLKSNPSSLDSWCCRSEPGMAMAYYPANDARKHSSREPLANPTNGRKVVIPRDSQCAVGSYRDAYFYCLNSEIFEEHIAKINPNIKYVDEIRAGLVQGRFTGGWEPGEAWRRGLSFDRTSLCDTL